MAGGDRSKFRILIIMLFFMYGAANPQLPIRLYKALYQTQAITINLKLFGLCRRTTDYPRASGISTVSNFLIH